MKKKEKEVLCEAGRWELLLCHVDLWMGLKLHAAQASQHVGKQLELHTLTSSQEVSPACETESEGSQEGIHLKPREGLLLT